MNLFKFELTNMHKKNHFIWNKVRWVYWVYEKFRKIWKSRHSFVNYYEKYAQIKERNLLEVFLNSSFLFYELILNTF